MDIFFALSEPRRRKMLELLASSGQLPAGEICKRFDITAQAVSQHLKILRDAGLVNVERRAQQRIYSINTAPMLELAQWASQTTKLWDDRFDELERVLENEKKGYIKTKVRIWKRKRN
ncbi:MAG: helix-turn-helix transcriptional regulator [Candidatus Micrarchaeota archaeon]|nr:helix-turn-helix transcriptional regulator [Candidatus Micrarchaeota archaeon]